jgi:glyoxylase-like metal-dependent hydrolase (beta-lactamase superfamily II)
MIMRRRHAAVKLNDDVYVLPLSMVRDGQTYTYNLSLILDPTQGPTLVDTGLPGQLEQIGGALAPVSVQVADLKRIVLTHQDIDHVGSLHDLAQASGALVLAHEIEAPFIDGTELPRFAAPAMLASRPEMRPVVERFQPTPVDQRLQDGARLDLAGGARVVFTPGHTIGHMCLYLERSRTVIAGDALTAIDGRLHGPNQNATSDMATAVRSVQKLAALEVQAIVCYHGGVVQEDAGGQLRRLTEELAQ